MKSVKRRLAAAVLSLAVVLSMMPAAAFTAWADDSGKDVVAEETSNEMVSKDADDDLQLEDEAEPEVSLGADIELNPLVVDYTSAEAKKNCSDIKLTNTGTVPVTVYPGKLSFSNKNFIWTVNESLGEEVTLEAGDEAIVATVEPKSGLAADWYYGYVTYKDYDDGKDLYDRIMVYFAVLKDGLSLDVYDDDDKDITLFDLGSMIAGSGKAVSQDFWVTNDGTVPFTLSFDSVSAPGTPDGLFIVTPGTNESIVSDEDVRCNIKVDPNRISGLQAGTYTGNVTAKATAADGKINELETIPVIFRVTDAPKWATLEDSGVREAGTWVYGIPLYIDNLGAFKGSEEDYIKADLVEGSDFFEMSKYVNSDYTNLYLKNYYPEAGTYTAKIKLLYDPTGSGNFDDAQDLGTMTYTLSVVKEGTYELSLVNKEYDPDTELIDLGMLTTGYTEKQAEGCEVTLIFENTGEKDLDVSGNGFGCYYSSNGEEFVWTEGAEPATLKPGELYSKINIRPQVGMEPGVYYDYFYLYDESNIAYAEFSVRYIVANKGQSMEIIDGGGLFDEPKMVDPDEGVIFAPSFIRDTPKTYYKWIEIHNTGNKDFTLNISDIEDCKECEDLYSYYMNGQPVKDTDVFTVKSGSYKTLRIELDAKKIEPRTATTYKSSFKVNISDESGARTERPVPVSYTITDQTYRVSMDLQGKGHYDDNKVEADFPEGTKYKTALTQLNSMIVGDTSNIWPVDDEYTVIGFTKNPDSAYSSWEQLIEAQKEVSNQEIDGDTDIYVNWAKKIPAADVTAVLPAGGTTAGTAITASVDKDAPYSIYEVSWKDMDDKDVLDCNEAYPLEVKLDADFGYAFSADSNIRINGVYATRTSAANTVSHATANRKVMIGHDWDEGKVTKEATADSEGVKTFTCRHCKKTKTEAIPKVSVADGTTHSTDAGTVKIVSEKNQTAAFVKPASNKKSVTVPATVNVAGKTFAITSINAGAFKGTKTTTLTVKTKKLTKKSVKGSLKGSKIKTVKVKVGKKSVNKKYVKKYKKIFTKKNAGKKVKVK